MRLTPFRTIYHQDWSGSYDVTSAQWPRFTSRPLCMSHQSTLYLHSVHRCYCAVIIQSTSVADPKCLSRIRDPTKKEVTTKFHKIENCLIFWTDTEIDLSQLTQNLSIFTQNVVTKCSVIWVGSGIRDPESGIRKKLIPDPGVKKASDPRFDPNL